MFCNGVFNLETMTWMVHDDNGLYINTLNIQVSIQGLYVVFENCYNIYTTLNHSHNPNTLILYKTNIELHFTTF